jgi:DNA-binding XRE family transcriptional regulator
MKKEENIVKQVCKELNINQAELARELGVSPATITDWNNGKIPKMAKLALKYMIENRELKKHLSNIRNFYETMNAIQKGKYFF